MERRRQEDDELEQKVVQLTVGVIGLSSALTNVGNALKDDVQGLRDEIETQRKLAKYARRTWFEVMAWIFLTGMLISDLSRSYCYPELGGNRTFPEACDTIFWTTSHGGGWEWRLLGGFITIMFLVWMGHRSQVPESLFTRVPAGASKPEEYRTWYYRWKSKRRRS